MFACLNELFNENIYSTHSLLLTVGNESKEIYNKIYHILFVVI